MDGFLNLLKKQKKSELVVMFVFIVYLVSGYKIGEPFATMIDSIPGKVVLLLLVVFMFMRVNPVLAILGLFVAFEMMRTASIVTGNDALHRYALSEEKKEGQMSSFNQMPYTLEQEVVDKMAPLVQSSSSLTPASYVPSVDEVHNASNI